MNRSIIISQTRVKAGLVPRFLLFRHQSIVSDIGFRPRFLHFQLTEPAFKRRSLRESRSVRVAASNGAAKEEGRAIMIAVDTSQVKL